MKPFWMSQPRIIKKPPSNLSGTSTIPSNYAASDGSFHYAYLYDHSSHPIEVTDLITGQKNCRRYDSSGRMESEILANGLKADYCYDRIDRPRKISLPDGTAVTYHYRGIHLHQICRLNAQGERLYDHTYDSYNLDGTLSHSRLIGNCGEMAYVYDPVGRIVEIASSKFKEKIESRDDAGNLLAKTTQDP